MHRVQRVHVGYVRTGGEGLGPAAGDNDRPHLVVSGKSVAGLSKLRIELGIKCIQSLGAVQGDHRDTLIDLHQDGFVRHYQPSTSLFGVVVKPFTGLNAQ